MWQPPRASTAGGLMGGGLPAVWLLAAGCLPLEPGGLGDDS